MRLPASERTPQAMANLQQRLGAVPGVTRTEARTESGSIVVYHRDDYAVDDILAQAGLVSEGLLDAVPPRLRGEAGAEASKLAQGVSNWLSDMDGRLSRATDGWLDLKMAVPLGLLGTAAWRTLAEGLVWAELPPYVLLYYTFDAFMKLHYMGPHPAIDSAAPVAPMPE